MSLCKKSRWVRPQPPDFLEIAIRHDPLKRIFDILFSLSVIILFAPVFISIALLVRLTSPGPIFYKSVRLGRGGRVIYCWKFRSMYRDADERLSLLLANNPRLGSEWAQFQKLKNDPRITMIGKFLRKTSLDEWPQFWNVLKGDLSIVGPRPPVLMGPPERFADEIRKWYGFSTGKILSIRPGLTGVWQISGRSEISFDERVRLEETYAETRTFWKDLILIIKTIPAVLFSKGAY
ncbi:MAG: wcaJ [Parachlamydiales bacterium]|nr:wcaJ [Parachlamydiales bacterium]